ncbi:MAG: tetratricopeptide repeat protein [Gemmatimonadota bacterium]|nr:MAG: tetratricopeptide repeat protein [Gemmatimonadota bacterium]
MKTILSLLLLLALTACAQGEPDIVPLEDLPDGAQAISLLGDTLVPPTPSAQAQARLEQNRAEAMAAFDSAPYDPEALIWVGRREAYLGNYRTAIRVFTKGVAEHPDDARMYRHRGHRFITIRMFDRAIADFQIAAELTEGQADEVEPDGAPNAAGIPTSTLQFNIYYHLGLAHYLDGDFDAALAAYRECMERSDIPDRLVATSHWMYMTLRRLGQDDEAAALLEPIHADLQVIENDAYHNLLLMYKGEIPPEDLLGPEEDAVQSATVAYGVGNWHYYNGRTQEADRILNAILEGEGWAAFGFIAAEADLYRREAGL